MVPTPIVTLEGPAATRVPTPMEGPGGAVNTEGGVVARVPTLTVCPGGVFRVLPTLAEDGERVIQVSQSTQIHITQAISCHNPELSLSGPVLVEFEPDIPSVIHYMLSGTIALVDSFHIL